MIDELIGLDARERLAEVKRGLRSILDLLQAPVATGASPETPEEFALASPAAGASAPRAAKRSAPDEPPKPASPRRKRSA